MSLKLASSVDIIIECGTDREVLIQVLDAQGDPYNLVDHTITLYMTDIVESGKIILKKDGEIISGRNGVAMFVFEPADTRHLRGRSYAVQVVADHQGKMWLAFNGTIGLIATVDTKEDSEDENP